MSLEALYATQQAAHDAIVAAGVETGARVRLPRRSNPHPGSLSLGTGTNNGKTRHIARVRFANVRRNQWVTLTESHLDRLEVKVGSRYVPLAELRKGGV